MRYKIEINLLALHQMKSKISLEEAVLLDYLYWLCNSPSEEVEEMRVEKGGRKYTWFDYGFYIKETPILRGKTKATITPKIKKLEEEEFIETINYAGEGDKFSKKYIRLLPKIDGLFRKLNKVVKKTKQPLFRKLNIDNNTTIDNNTIDKLAIQRIAYKKEIDSLIEKFKGVNPSYEQLFKNKTQRGALQRLVKKYGVIKTGNMIDYLPKIFGKPYAPVITTPYLLEQKLANLINYIQQRSQKKPNIVKI